MTHLSLYGLEDLVLGKSESNGRGPLNTFYQYINIFINKF